MRTSTIPKTHTFIRSREDPVFGSYKIFKHQATEELVIMKEKTLNSKSQVTLEISSTDRRFGMRHPNLVEMMDWAVESTSQLCATFYKLQTYYQFTPSNLGHYILKKKKENQYLDETEIMQLCYDGIDALAFLQTNNVNHGYIRPELIFVHPNGRYVLCDRLLEGTGRDSNIYAHRTKMKLYCSPAYWSEISADRRQPHNPYKDDAFSFGLILLAACNLASPQDIYEKNGTINQSNLDRHIQTAASRYESLPVIGQVLERLLNIDETKRWDFLSLFNSMPSRQEIQNFFDTQEESNQFYDPNMTMMHDKVTSQGYFDPQTPLTSGIKVNKTESTFQKLPETTATAQKYYPPPGGINYAEPYADQNSSFRLQAQPSQIMSHQVHSKPIHSQSGFAYDFDGEQNRNIVDRTHITPTPTYTNSQFPSPGHNFQAPPQTFTPQVHQAQQPLYSNTSFQPSSHGQFNNAPQSHQYVPHQHQYAPYNTQNQPSFF